MTLNLSDVRFETAALDDVRQMIDWAADEGWNPGVDDAEAFWSTDKHGFFVARIAREMVAAVSVVNHDDHVAFLGLYLCRPEFRGQGIGFALWKHGLEHAGTRCIGLDGVLAQEANYETSGFVKHGSVLRLQGRIPGCSMEQARLVNAMHDGETVTRLDATATGYDRGQFLDQWVFNATPSRKTVVLETPGTLSGFATARACLEGIKVGPIVAKSTDDALVLLSAAASNFSSELVTVDIPSRQKALLEALEKMGFTSSFQTAHMFRGRAPHEGETYRAVASMECG
ncbi:MULTISPECIES: GNAT family N-acetyltransferase [Halocynthiibacter]|uniref:GNAT family N-acetyltransferase n=1 Tax=Halocynthiibacter halioticoli TaxID=2986804 RepID=A0AAE3IVP2_9RHOB|nr:MULTISPECIES: GNAT family N-acetyltransferase [Halocynthiibacter]MCV6822933.1 GNAT family N-acetyltransferase [Halocynthiibacter halioticoli]MCW4055934.1 GNAT family N-acetyltransferase [Halocynthiibacter sp. SDUM655004]